MKLVKIFGAVMAVHAAVFMFVFAIPGCRSTGKKTAAPAASPVAEASPVAPSETAAPAIAAAAPAEVASIRFSPTRPGTPAAAEIESTPAAVAPSDYVVAKGDTLWSIAKKHGVSIKQLAVVNNIRSDAPLKLGQKLVIPGKAAAVTPVSAKTAPAAVTAAAAPVSAKSAGGYTHVVKAGETLGVIAKKYQLKVGDIATANNIADPTKLRVGQSLKIPGWQQPAAKTPAPAVAPAPSVPVTAPAPAAPVESSPVMTSPFLSPAPAGDSPISAAPSVDQGAPVIRIEESGAPKIE